MLVLCLLLGSQLPPVALAPVVADGLSLSEVVPLDAAVRRAFAARPGALDGAGVQASYAAARANGLTCAPTSLDCLVQVGVVVGAEQIVLARLRPGAVTLALVDVTGARWLRRAEAPLGADLDASLLAAFAALDTAPPWTEPAATDGLAGPGASSASAGPPLLALGVGGGLALFGAAAATTGLLPLFQALAASDDLAKLDADGQGAGSARAGYAADVAAARAAFDEGKKGWDELGIGLVVIGAAALGAGVGVVAGALTAELP